MMRATASSGPGPLDLVLGPPVVGRRLGPQSDFREVGIELQPLLAHGRAHEVSHEPLGGAGILGPHGYRVVDRESAVLPRQEQRDSLLVNESRFAQQRENLMPEQQLGRPRVDPENREPIAALRPTAPAHNGMDVRMEIDRRAEGLDHGHHSGADLFTRRGDHHLAHGLPGGSHKSPNSSRCRRKYGRSIFGTVNTHCV